jgi:spermidine/putrescine transport system ATP-binding protein
LANHEQQPGTRTPSSDLAVELRDVSKLYGTVRALDDVSMGIKRGEFFCLLGPSGCGKTTTLNIVGGFIPLSHGHVYIDGKDVTDDPPYRRAVNTVFQNYALFPHMSVAQNVGFGLRMKKVPPVEIEQRVQEVLRLVSLEWAGNRGAKQLSGGQQQRVALVRALVNRPAVLLLDEPLGALDLKLRKQLQVELRNIQRQVGITFIHVTHDQEEAMSMSDRIAVMSGGKAVQIGSPADIYYRPETRFVADFIGESNFFNGRVLEIAADRVLVEIPGFARPVQTCARPFASVGADVTVMVRPERIRLSTQPPADTLNMGQGVLAKTSFMGMYTQLFVEIGAGLTKIFSPNETGDATFWPDRLGQPIYLSWNAEDSILLRQ